MKLSLRTKEHFITTPLDVKNLVGLMMETKIMADYGYQIIFEKDKVLPMEKILEEIKNGKKR